MRRRRGAAQERREQGLPESEFTMELKAPPPPADETMELKAPPPPADETMQLRVLEPGMFDSRPEESATGGRRDRRKAARPSVRAHLFAVHATRRQMDTCGRIQASDP